MNSTENPATGGGSLNRRKLLSLVGAGAAGVVLTTGTASATRFQFYGCSQVCSDSRGGHAVVATDGTFECRPLFGDFNSDRQNQDWKHGSRCYEVSGDEAIVGILRSKDSGCTFCVNPNNCASNKYDSEQDIVDALNDSSTCGECGRDGAVTAGSCDTSGTGRGPNGGGPSNGGGQGNGPPSGGNQGPNGSNGRGQNGR